MYSKQMIAGWSDMDFNGHMKNTAFIDRAADVRLMFFAENGFPVAEFARLRLGPVIVREEIDYRKEVNLLDPIEVTLALGGLSPDASRWLLETNVRRDGKLCSRIRASGAWLALDARRMATPPPALRAALEKLEQTADFETLRSAVRPTSTGTLSLD